MNGHFWERKKSSKAIWWRVSNRVQSALCLHEGLPLPRLGADGRLLNTVSSESLGTGRGGVMTATQTSRQICLVTPWRLQNVSGLTWSAGREAVVSVETPVRVLEMMEIGTWSEQVAQLLLSRCKVRYMYGKWWGQKRNSYVMTLQKKTHWPYLRKMIRLVKMQSRFFNLNCLLGTEAIDGCTSEGNCFESDAFMWTTVTWNLTGHEKCA